MGCVDPVHSGDLQVASGSIAACMIAAGLRPREDAFLGALVNAYRRFALKGVVVCPRRIASSFFVLTCWWLPVLFETVDHLWYGLLCTKVEIHNSSFTNSNCSSMHGCRRSAVCQLRREWC